MEVSLGCSDPEASIAFRAGGGVWLPYEGPFTLDTATVIEAVALRTVPNDGGKGRRSKQERAQFIWIDGSRTMTLESAYAPQYAAGGEQALVDGLRGGNDYRTGEWQGFQGQHLLATVDLGRVERVRRLGLGVLQDQRSWIWYPAVVEFAVSMNGRQWSSVVATHDVSREEEGALTKVLWTGEVAKRARYVKIIARSAGPCPEWHPGAGHPSWIFADEFLLETE
jgi:hypothetical protein